MRLDHRFIFFFLITSLVGCLPDSFTKWDKEEPNVIVSPSTVSIEIDGENVNVAESSNGTAPRAITLAISSGSLESQTVSSENEVEDNVVKIARSQELSITPSFIDESGSDNTYFYSLEEDISGTESRFDYSQYDLDFDSSTGILSGTPETFIPETNLILKAYHVESGQWLYVGFSLAAATSFNDAESTGSNFYFPISKDDDSYYILELDDVSSFSACPHAEDAENKCFSTDNGIEAYIEYINISENKLFVKIANTDVENFEDKTFENATTADNANEFVSFDANIVTVTRVFKRCTDTELESDSETCEWGLTPTFNFELDESEKSTLEWSITPLPPGGIKDDGSFTDIGFVDDSIDGGMLKIPSSSTELSPTEYTITVKNILGETLSTKINLSVTQAPSNLGVGNLYLLTLDSNEEFRVGDFISSDNESDARGKILEKIGTEKIAIELLKGDFNPDDQVDHLKVFSRKRGVVKYKTLFNSVLTITGDSIIDSLKDDDPEKDEYRNTISQNDAQAIIKELNSSLVGIEVYGGAHQFSPGLQIVQAGEDFSCNNGEGIATTGAVGTIVSIVRNADDETTNDIDTTLIVNTLSGTFTSNLPIQLGGSMYDCSTTSVDLVSEVMNISGTGGVDGRILFHQVYAMVPNGDHFQIANPNEIDSNIKLNTEVADAALYSLWSQNISFKSINQAGNIYQGNDSSSWREGDYISTRSHIPGVINGVEDFTEAGSESGYSVVGIAQDEDGQIVTAHFNQIGFLFASLDQCNSDDRDDPGCINDSDHTTLRNPGRGDQGNFAPEFIFSKGSTYKFENIMNMSAFDADSELEDDGDSDGNGSDDDLYRDDSQIKELKTTHHHVFYAREPMVLKSELQYGDAVVFDLSNEEDLPEGLNFDASTGTISGTPSEKLSTTEFTLTARNPIGSQDATFILEIKDHFSVTIPTNFVDAESYKFHMSGQGNQSTSCRITNDQLEGDNQDVKDILCYLEAGEMDLYFHGMEMQFDVGPSMCEFVSFEPYTIANMPYNSEKKYEYIKSGTRGRYKVGSGITELNTVGTINDETAAKIIRTYTYDEGCTQCFVPEINNVIPCSQLDSANTSNGNIVKCDSNWNSIINDGLEHPNCDDGFYVEREINIGKDDFALPNEEVIKDGVCGVSSGLDSSILPTQELEYSKFDRPDGDEAPGELTDDQPLNDIAEAHEFSWGTLTFTIKGVPNNDIDQDTVIDIVKGNGSDFDFTTTELNISETFLVACSDGTSDSNRYTINDIDQIDDPDDFIIEYTVTTEENSEDGTPCDSTLDIYGQDPTDGGAVKSFPVKVTEITGFKHAQISLKGIELTRNIDTDQFDFGFLDNDSDGALDSIVYFSGGEIQIHECGEGECVDADGDGLFDYLDLNGDKLADDIISSVDITGSGSPDDADGLSLTGTYIVGESTPGQDGWGDHTLANTAGRVDATISEIKNFLNETVESCGGEPYNCLMGSNKLLTSHEWNGARPIRTTDAVYGVDSQVYAFDGQIASEFGANNFLSNYSKSSSCGVNPLVIHQNSVFHNPDDNGLYETDEALDSSEVSGTAGTPLLLNGVVNDFVTHEFLFWEILTSYQNENFYKGLGDLLYDDFSNLEDDDGQDGDGDGDFETSDFNASVTLPYVYKEKITNKANALTELETHPQLGFAKKNGEQAYEIVTIESDVDSNITNNKEEISFFDSGYKNLSRLAKGSVIALPINFTGANHKGMTVEYFPHDARTEEVALRGVVLDYIWGTDIFIKILVTYTSENFVLEDLLSDYDGGGGAIDSHPFFLEGIVSTNRIDTKQLFYVDASEVLPYVVGYGKYNLGHSAYEANPFYTFECLDAARDLKARIRVQVREWDRVFTAGHDIDKTIPSSLMDDSSIDLWEQDFDNKWDGDYSTRKYNSCLIDYPSTWDPANYPYPSLPNFDGSL